MLTLTYRDALNQALREEMQRDDRVFLMGEEVAEYNGAYKVSQGMLDRFGPRRIVDTPISEEGFAGLGIGAAMVGLRPIIEFMTYSFSYVAFDQLVNNAANVRYMSGGQFSVPIVFRGNSGIAGSLGATHSHRPEALFAHIPGLTVMAGPLTSAILSRNDERLISLDRVRGKFYPQDYVWTAPHVDRVLRHGESIEVATFRVTLLETPGLRPVQASRRSSRRNAGRASPIGRFHPGERPSPAARAHGLSTACRLFADCWRVSA